MTITRDELATAVAGVLDARMGVLEPEPPTLSDFEVADALLARFVVSERLDSLPGEEQK
jgi:hypothetical protein